MVNDQKIKTDAIRAGEKTLKSLKDAQKSLSKLQEKGLLDVLGPLSLSSSKNNAMLDDIKRNLKKAKDDLNVFVDKISGIMPHTAIAGLSGKAFDNIYSFDKTNIEKFNQKVKESIKAVELALRTLKK